MSVPTLSPPDFCKSFTIECDASEVAIRGVVTQEFDGFENVITYASRSLSPAERINTVSEKKLLAIIFFVMKNSEVLLKVHILKYKLTMLIC